MKQEILFSMSSPYRDKFRIQGFTFGEGERSAAIVGTMRGDEVQQQYTCSQMVQRLRQLEKQGLIAEGKSILVIPSCNPFSLNVGRRFWAMDSTDINRMFPGYDQGETTQRIAAAVFKHLEGYTYGMQLTSFYIPGHFVPHIRMLATGYEDIQGARLFGLPFVTTYKPKPFDTTLLNYNWQIWNTRAFSIYGSETERVNPQNSQMIVDATIRFLSRTGILNYHDLTPSYDSICFDESELHNIRAKKSGIVVMRKAAGQHVEEGDLLAEIIDPYDGSVSERILAPAPAILFFVHNKPLVLQSGILFKLKVIG